MPEDRLLLERIKREVPVPGPALGRLRDRERRSRRNRRISALVLGTTLTGVLVAALARTAFVGENDRSGALRPAAGVDLALPPGEYYFERRVVYELASWPPDRDGQFPFVSRLQHKVWWQADGSGRAVMTGLERAFFTDEEGETVQRRCPECFGVIQVDDSSFGATESSERLPADMDGLREFLASGDAPRGASPAPPAGAPGHEAGVWHLVTVDLLGRAPSLEQRAALVEILSTLDGVTVERGTIDPLGRPAVALRGPDPTPEWPAPAVLYVDPDSLQWLAGVFPDRETGLPRRVEVAVALGTTSTPEAIDMGTTFIPTVPVGEKDTRDTGPIPDPRR